MSNQVPMRPVVTIGLNTYPDGTIHYLPYTFGVRAPFVDPPPGSKEAAENDAYARGAYEGAWRVGTAGLVVGLGIGLVGAMLLYRR